MAGKTRNYTEDFKKQMVALRENGKSVVQISTEYDIAKSTINKWVSDYGKSGSFKAKDNRTQEENDLIKLRKENKQLLMENDILKQAALIMARR
jgi:transposase